jgi:hypothetical protein
MPAGLILLTLVGNQNLLLNGNPTYTPFKATYKRYPNFAIEPLKQYFKYVPKQLSIADNVQIRSKIDRNADAIADTYFVINIPDIYSPVRIVDVDSSANKQPIPVEFQWVPHLGYNMIDSVSLIINGQKIVTHTGEWMKLQSQTMYNYDKRELSDKMIGHTTDMYDPGNIPGKNQQYPNAIVPIIPEAIEPSIRGRKLVIPFMFFFCEDFKQILPIIKLESAEIELLVTLKRVQDLYTIIDTDYTSNTFMQRIKPDVTKSEHLIANFLGAPTSNGTTSQNLGLCWVLDPYLEVNYIFMDEDERRQLALKSQEAMLIKEVKVFDFQNLWGTANLELDTFNLVSQFKWVTQRSDIIQSVNGWDNYTNWSNELQRPFVDLSMTDYAATGYYSSGALASNGPKNIMQSAQIFVLNGKQIMEEKEHYYFITEQFRKYVGNPTIEGIYQHSFGLNNWEFQPSGAMNASAADKVHLRLSLQTPPTNDEAASNNPPSIYSNADVNGNTIGGVTVTCGGTNTGSSSTLGLSRNIAQYTRTPFEYFLYAYNVRVYVESYNVLIFADGTAGMKYAT